jgi:hypothetical protein
LKGGTVDTGVMEPENPVKNLPEMVMNGEHSTSKKGEEESTSAASTSMTTATTPIMNAEVPGIKQAAETQTAEPPKPAPQQDDLLFSGLSTAENNNKHNENSTASNTNDGKGAMELLDFESAQLQSSQDFQQQQPEVDLFGDAPPTHPLTATTTLAEMTDPFASIDEPIPAEAAEESSIITPQTASLRSTEPIAPPEPEMDLLGFSAFESHQALPADQAVATTDVLFGDAPPQPLTDTTALAEMTDPFATTVEPIPAEESASSIITPQPTSVPSGLLAPPEPEMDLLGFSAFESQQALPPDQAVATTDALFGDAPPQPLTDTTALAEMTDPFATTVEPIVEPIPAEESASSITKPQPASVPSTELLAQPEPKANNSIESDDAASKTPSDHPPSSSSDDAPATAPAPSDSAEFVSTAVVAAPPLSQPEPAVKESAQLQSVVVEKSSASASSPNENPVASLPTATDAPLNMSEQVTPTSVPSSAGSETSSEPEKLENATELLAQPEPKANNSIESDDAASKTPSDHPPSSSSDDAPTAPAPSDAAEFVSTAAVAASPLSQPEPAVKESAQLQSVVVEKSSTSSPSLPTATDAPLNMSEQVTPTSAPSSAGSETASEPEKIENAASLNGSAVPVAAPRVFLETALTSEPRVEQSTPSESTHPPPPVKQEEQASTENPVASPPPTTTDVQPPTEPADKSAAESEPVGTKVVSATAAATPLESATTSEPKENSNQPPTPEVNNEEAEEVEASKQQEAPTFGFLFSKAKPENHRDRLFEFYKKHNPSKLDSIDATLARYVGREDVMFRQLEQKYVTATQEAEPLFPEPPPSSSSSAPAAPAAPADVVPTTSPSKPAFGFLFKPKADQPAAAQTPPATVEDPVASALNSAEDGGSGTITTTAATTEKTVALAQAGPTEVALLPAPTEESVSKPASSSTQSAAAAADDQSHSTVLQKEYPIPQRLLAALEVAPSSPDLKKKKSGTEKIPAISDPDPTNKAPAAQTQTTTQEEIPPSQRMELMEKELHAAHTLIMQLQHKEEEDANGQQRANDAIMVEIQANLHEQMTQRAEAEDSLRRARAETQQLEQQLALLREETDTRIEDLNQNLIMVVEEQSTLVLELVKIREERDEQARKEAALTSRLNAAKKKEGAKANKDDHYEEQLDSLENHVEEANAELTKVQGENGKMKNELTEVKDYSRQKIKQLETLLADERKLNDERKRKMKSFVEAKTEEVRSSKADSLSFQTELDQTNRGFKELNQRLTQLHAQWVQSQTRNRELQRDMNKIQNDSERMHKVGGTLEMKLSRSAQETEEHKNKRLTAKSELIAVLRQLEVEQEVNSRMRDSIKFTFTPKALSQQQIIQETLDDFESQLQKLAIRLGRPLAPRPENGAFASSRDMSDKSADMEDVPDDGDIINGESSATDRLSLSEVTTGRLLTSLESETQRVSQCIMTFTTSVERMNVVLQGRGSRNCVSSLQDLLSRTATATIEEREAMTTSGSRRITGGQRYGQVPRSTLT